MRRTLVYAVALSLAGAGAAAASDAARSQFQTNCRNCHRPPDLGFPTDRAWLGQISRTA